MHRGLHRIRVAASVAGMLAARTLVAAAQSPAAPLPSAPTAEVRELQRDLREILRAPGWSGARFGVLVVSLDRGDTLFAVDPDLPLAPASNLKLFSSAAALYHLGPDFRFSTLLLADGPVADGALHGDLILYGTGDPTLSGRMLGSSTAVLRALADSLVAHGVREVHGDVVGDGSFFDARWTAPGWTPGDLEQWYGAPVGALSLAENMVRLEVLPGEVGEAARLRTLPATRGLAVRNRVRTVARGAASVRFEREGDALVVTGQLGAGSAGVVRTLPVVDPANFAAAALRAVLEERGVRVVGGVRSVRDARNSRVGGPGSLPAPGPARLLAVHRSPPLGDVAYVTNHVSHNLFADALLKTAARVAGGEGSFAAGEALVRAMLARETGVGPEALRVLDGSGLSRLNRATARATVHLLDFMRRSGVAAAFEASLPEAGSAQGLRRMHGTEAAGRLRAKTGTIRTVSALSGYVTAANGERLAFSILANGVPSTARQKHSEDAIGARLARFRRPLPAAGAPLPPGEPPR